MNKMTQSTQEDPEDTDGVLGGNPTKDPQVWEKSHGQR